MAIHKTAKTYCSKRQLPLEYPLNKGVSQVYLPQIQSVFAENTSCIHGEYKLYFPYRTCLYNLFSVSADACTDVEAIFYEVFMKSL